MYRYENEQLFKIQFAIYAVEALTNQRADNHRLLFAEQKYQDSQLESRSNEAPLTGAGNSGSSKSNNQFVSTLYIGFHKNNLYALPSLVYSWQSMQLITDEAPPPLISNHDPNKEPDINSS